MAEAIGITASIISILELSGRAIKYLKAVKDAQEDRKKLLNEVVNAVSLLSLLRIRLEAPQDPQNDSNSPLEALKQLMIQDGPLYQFQSLLARLVDKLQPGDAKGVKKLKDLMWPFKHSEYKDIIDSLERFKTCLLLAIQNDHFELSQEIGNIMESVQREITNIQCVVTGVSNEVKAVNREITFIKASQEARFQEQQNREILEWLSPLNFSGKQKEVFESRQEGTGLWVLDSALFKGWVAGNTPILFCPGIPGAGKTVLSSIINDHLDRNYSQDKPSVAVVYIYCNYNEQKEQTATDLMGSILRQISSKLLLSSPELPIEVVTFYNTNISTRTRPSLHECTNTLWKVSKLFSRIFITIDALDECAESYELLTTLRGLLFGAENLSFLATSRHIKNIDDLFENVPQLEISANETDVRKYLDAQIKRRPRLMGHIRKNPSLANEIIETISQKAQGMFLLAQLHFDTVSTKHTVKKIRDTLHSLPQSLDATYDDSMSRIAAQYEDDHELAIRILTWITSSFSPLDIRTLQVAVTLEPGVTELDDEDLPDVDLMVSVCAGLVTMEPSHFTSGHEHGSLRLVHYTAQEYFSKNRERYFPRAHSEIATTLITYLSLEIFNEGPVIGRDKIHLRQFEYPLLNYAANSWGNHVREQSDPTVKEMVLEYLQQRTKLASAVEILFYRFRARKYVSRELETEKALGDAECILVAAYFGMDEIFWHLVEMEHPDLTMTNSVFETPLIMAAKNGRESMVRSLLGYEKVRQLVDSTDIDGKSAFSWAAQNGHQATLFLLLDHNAKPDQRDRTGRSPLSLAASHGWSNVVEALLATPNVNPNSRDKGGWTPLLWAARLGKLQVVRILLAQEGVNCDTPDEEGRTPLSWAATSGEEAMVELLLSRKEVNPDSRDSKYGRTPLARAAENGHSGVVKLLLARQDVNPDQTDFDGYTPLTVAAKFGREDVVRLLLSREDVNPNTKAKGGKTPLYWAARKGYESVLSLLLERVDVNPYVKDEYGHTPLTWAQMNGHEAVMRQLMRANLRMGEMVDRIVDGGDWALWGLSTAPTLVDEASNAIQEGDKVPELLGKDVHLLDDESLKKKRPRTPS